ncbi:MAG: class I SAM-dependent methyltransferase [Bdellovibrionota bacterium]
MDIDQYQLLDSGGFRKLEQVGPFRLIRPSLQAVWQPRLPEIEWKKIDAIFTRGKGGDGRWKILRKNLPEHWPIQIESITALIRLTDFGHIGIFPEHHHWQRLNKQIQTKNASANFRSEADNSFKLLNLFAYTGIASLLAASMGAFVVHVDASKTSVGWGRENAQASNLDGSIRWIVDDVQKFLAREIRRGSRYDAVVLDPPSFGRGPKGNLWKIEDHLVLLLQQIREVLADDVSFVQLSAHSPGMTPITLHNLLSDGLAGYRGKITADEMWVTEAGENGRKLPSGACAVFER